MSKPIISLSAKIAPVEGGTIGTYSITLNTPAPIGGLTINFNTLGSTATFNTDYNFALGENLTAVTKHSFTIAAGATTATLNLIAHADTVADPNETVVINLTQGAGYELSNKNHDDDYENESHHDSDGRDDANHEDSHEDKANLSATHHQDAMVASPNHGNPTASLTIIEANHAPVLNTPTTIHYIDTACVDNFAIVTGSLVASDVDANSTLTYGIAGAIDYAGSPISVLSDARGLLTVDKATGAYSFTPWDIESLTTNVTDTFTVTVSDGQLTDSKPLTISVTQRGITESNGNDILIGTSGNDAINGLAGADTMIGGKGDDTYWVAESGDVVIERAGEGNDTVNVYFHIVPDYYYYPLATTPVSVYTLPANVENMNLVSGREMSLITGIGNDLNNRLIVRSDNSDTFLDGRGGDDILVGVPYRINTMLGGTGNDSFYVYSANDVVIEYAGEGVDTVYMNFFGFDTSYTLTANVENLVILNGGAYGVVFSGIGNELNNHLTGDNNDNTLSGLAGNDTINGGAGNDTIDGGLGADSMRGGAGDDTYYVDNVGDKVIELAGEGVDTVYYMAYLANSTYTLSANVENLIFNNWRYSGTGIGNALDNSLHSSVYGSTLYGLAGNDSLYGADGKNGSSELIGGIGNDNYYVDGYISVNDVIVEQAGEGNDTVYATASCTLADNVENLVLVGDRTDRGIFRGTGNALDNHLTGSGTQSVLEGLGGDDNYYVGNEGTVIVESAHNGWDSVLSTTNRTLEANVEELYLLGTDNLNGYGNAQNNKLNGNSGNNILDGGDGADTLIGGLGKDTYILTETTAATDTLVIAQGDSLIASYDTATDFTLGTNAIDSTGVDKLDLANTTIAANTAGVNGINAGIIHSHSISNGIISFDDINTFTAPLAITAANLANVFTYLQTNITGGNTVAFVSDADSYVFQDGGVNDTLVELVGVSAHSVNTSGLGAGAVWLA
jgi:Ca2+-binding RTX toxin-like protein